MDQRWGLLEQWQCLLEVNKDGIDRGSDKVYITKDGIDRGSDKIYKSPDMG